MNRNHDKLELSFNGGVTDAFLDMRMGEPFSYKEIVDSNRIEEFHSRFGGMTFYRTFNGECAKGFITEFESVMPLGTFTHYGSAAPEFRRTGQDWDFYIRVDNNGHISTDNSPMVAVNLLHDLVVVSCSRTKKDDFVKQVLFSELSEWEEKARPIDFQTAGKSLSIKACGNVKGINLSVFFKERLLKLSGMPERSGAALNEFTRFFFLYSVDGKYVRYSPTGHAAEVFDLDPISLYYLDEQRFSQSFRHVKYDKYLDVFYKNNPELDLVTIAKFVELSSVEEYMEAPALVRKQVSSRRFACRMTKMPMLHFNYSLENTKKVIEDLEKDIKLEIHREINGYKEMEMFGTLLLR